jgi:hypothetical protein
LADDPTKKRWGDGFEVETLINIRVFNAGLRIAEVASYESPRLFGVSNLSPIRDGFRVLRTIAAEQKNRGNADEYRFDPRSNEQSKRRRWLHEPAA